MTPFVGAFFLRAIQLCAMLRLRHAAMLGRLVTRAAVDYRRPQRRRGRARSLSVRLAHALRMQYISCHES
jgi:hypothetical protein